MTTIINSQDRINSLAHERAIYVKVSTPGDPLQIRVTKVQAYNLLYQAKTGGQYRLSAEVTPTSVILDLVRRTNARAS